MLVADLRFMNSISRSFRTLTILLIAGACLLQACGDDSSNHSNAVTATSTTGQTIFAPTTATTFFTLEPPARYSSRSYPRTSRTYVAADVTVRILNFGAVNLSGLRLLAQYQNNRRSADVALSLDPSSRGATFRVVKKTRNLRPIGTRQAQLEILYQIEVFPAY